MSTPSSTGQQRRQVQQRTTAARRDQERLDQRRQVRRRVILGSSAIGLVIAVASVVVLTLGSPTTQPVTRSPSRPVGTTTVVTEPFQLGNEALMSATAPPWPIPTTARPYIAAAGLRVLGREALTVHYHAHLDVIVNGMAATVPAAIGFVIENGQDVGVTVLHTQNASGIIHVESLTDAPYTLGQFVTEWGVRLGPGQLGGLTDSGGNTLRIYVDGREFAGDPATIVLRPHQEIALWYGPPTATPNVPATYQFPAGD